MAYIRFVVANDNGLVGWDEGLVAGVGLFTGCEVTRGWVQARVSRVMFLRSHVRTEPEADSKAETVVSKRAKVVLRAITRAPSCDGQSG